MDMHVSGRVVVSAEGYMWMQIPALAQHELLQLPPLPPVLAASLLSMPPTLSGARPSQDTCMTSMSVAPHVDAMAQDLMTANMHVEQRS